MQNADQHRLLVQSNQFAEFRRHEDAAGTVELQLDGLTEETALEMTDGLIIESVAQIHRVLGREAPANPLITVVDNHRDQPVEPLVLNVRITSKLYAISLKNGSECGISYGRRSYDFQAFKGVPSEVYKVDTRTGAETRVRDVEFIRSEIRRARDAETSSTAAPSNERDG